ncbi:MAG: type I secretion system permease/ATPase, partial [Sphingorhabdus sp.]
RLMMRAALRMNRLMSAQILDRLMSRSRVKSGDPTTRQAMREFDTLRMAISGPAATALFDMPWTPLYFCVAAMIHPLLGLVVLGGAGILILLAILNERRTKAKSREAHAANAAAAIAHEAALKNADLIRALGMRRALVSRQIDERQTGLEATSDYQAISGRYNAMVKFVRMFMQSLALGVGAWLAVNGQISVGAIMAASVLLSRALSPIEQVVGAWPTLLQARLAVQTLDDLLTDDSPATTARTALPDPEGHLEAAHLVAKSPEGTAILLKNVSFDLKPGEVLGVIGPSGAGKSTLARIVAGAVAPDLGEIRIDGANFSDWDPETIAAHIGYLPQDCALLPGTIGENISRFAEAGGTPRRLVDREVIKAAKNAGVHEMILQFPSGYDTLLGEAGHQLSAGQAQRVALARAFYDEPVILVLDEPNAALDAMGEASLSNALSAAKERGAAIMIVAHRAAILAKVDKLLVLQDGAVAQYGSREDVLQTLREAGVGAGPAIVPIRKGAAK